MTTVLHKHSPESQCNVALSINYFFKKMVLNAVMIRKNELVSWHSSIKSPKGAFQTLLKLHINYGSLIKSMMVVTKTIFLRLAIHPFDTLLSSLHCHCCICSPWSNDRATGIVTWLPAASLWTPLPSRSLNNPWTLGQCSPEDFILGCVCVRKN